MKFFPHVKDKIAVINLGLPTALIDAMVMLKKKYNLVLFGDERALSISNESRIKNAAFRNRLLVLTPHSYANVVDYGFIGIVGTAGTAIQEAATLIDQNRHGISRSISCGSRDLHDKIGGIMTKLGLRILNEDKNTKIIMLILKPASEKMQNKILKEIQSLKKPIIVYAMRGKVKISPKSKIIPAFSIEDAVLMAIHRINGKNIRKKTAYFSKNEIIKIKNEQRKLSDQQKYVRGIFSGGSICNESLLILESSLGEVFSNVPFAKFPLKEFNMKESNVCIDMGHDTDDIPMTTPFKKNLRLLREITFSKNAVILTDVILGHGAHPDPAGKLVEILRKGKRLNDVKKRHVSIVVSVIGTNNDPQNYLQQVKKLENVGVIVTNTSTKAAKIAAAIALRKILKANRRQRV